MNAVDEISGSDDTPAMVCLSHSEISSLVNRAARGAGFEWGEADEAAFASVWLACAGLDWASPMLAILQMDGLKPPKPAVKIWNVNENYCPIRTGIAFADFANLDEGPKSNPVLLRQVFQPIILLPFAARVAEMCQTQMHVSFANIRVILSPSGAPKIDGFVPEDRVCDVVISCMAAPLTSPAWPADQRTTIFKKQYDALANLALKMTVPTSERSQSGAGGTDDP